ncbi:MFS transporter [Scopulibacillus cellulosilyticus]|uniref:MFS transporter n=1 Tax=Scopulibacillus cellulosilyticus TaxID=2665665 RepID=A0ABW2PXE7_9BACL
MRWFVLALLSLGLLIDFADKSIMGFAADPIMKEFHLTYSEWGIAGGAAFWLFSIVGVIGAALSDKVGTKKMLGFMIFFWSILQLGAFAVTGLSVLVLYRALLGAGEGPFTPTAMSHIEKWFAPESRGLAASIFINGSNVGSLVGAPVLVTMIVHFGWRIAFASLGILGFVVFIAWIFCPEKPKFKGLQTELGEDKDFPRKKFIWSEFYPILLSPACIFTLLIGFSSMWLTVWSAVWMPNYFTSVIHLTPEGMGWAVSAIGVIMIIVSTLISYFSDRMFAKNQDFRKSRVMVTGSSMVVTGLILSSLVLAHSELWAIIVFGFGIGLSQLAFIMLPQIMIRLLPERAGLMASIVTSFMNIAGIIGPMMTGFALQSAGHNVTLGFDHSILFIAAGLVLFGLLFSLFVDPDKKMRHLEPAIVKDSSLN